MIFYDITFFETKFSSDKKFSHLHSVNFRGDKLRALNDFVASFMIVSQVLTAFSSIAKNVLPVIYDNIVVESSFIAKIFILRIHRVQRNIESISYHDVMI